MMKPSVFLVVFVSTYILVQGLDQRSTGSQCQCCDQCDQTATVSKILLDMSNLLVNDDSVNTTAHPSTASTPSTTATSIVITKIDDATTTTTEPATTIIPSTTQNPSTIIYSSEIRDAPAPTAPVISSPSTPVNTSSSEHSSSAVNSSTTVVDPSTTANPSSAADSSTKSESLINAAILTDSPSSTINLSTIEIADSSAKMSVCPENCYLDISGEYCNCYLP